jgi:predicted PP-loop superfamily ATPase
MSRHDITNSAFARWLLHQARLAGYDTDAWETHASIAALAAVALSDGLDTEATAGVASMLAVTPEEVTTAYIGEMRQWVLADLRAHPDLADLDAWLNELARTL